LRNLVKMHKEIEKAGGNTINVSCSEDHRFVVMKFHMPGKDDSAVSLKVESAMTLAKNLVEACAFIEALRRIGEAAGGNPPASTH